MYEWRRIERGKNSVTCNQSATFPSIHILNCDSTDVRCPDCGDKTGQRKVPLLIHVEPKNLIALNYTNRYCYRCYMLIGHKHEIEQHLTELFSQINPEVMLLAIVIWCSAQLIKQLGVRI